MLDGSVMKMWLNAERSGNVPIADKFIVNGQEIELADSYAREQLNNINGGDVFIDDNVTSVDKVWSSQKVSQQMQQIGELTNLQTTDKSNIVNALNEVKNQKVDNDTFTQKIGDLSILQTTDKTSLINAINEINSNSNATVFVGDTQPTNGALYWLDTSASSGTGGGDSGTGGEGGTTTEWTYDRSKWVVGKRYVGTGSLGLFDDAKSMYYNELIPVTGKTTIRLIITTDKWGFFDINTFDENKHANDLKQKTIEGTAGATYTIPATASYIGVSVKPANTTLYDVNTLTLEVE